MDFGRGIDEEIGDITCTVCRVRRNLGKDEQPGLVILRDFLDRHTGAHHRISPSDNPTEDYAAEGRTPVEHE
jgi:hypothetical protein